jgi:hypothetical protein
VRNRARNAISYDSYRDLRSVQSSAPELNLGHVELQRVEELAFFGLDADGLPPGALAEDGGAAPPGFAAAEVDVPPLAEFVRRLGGEPLVGGQDSRWCGVVAEELRAELFSCEPEPDVLHGVGDRRQPAHLAGHRVGAQVPQFVAVDLGAVEPVGDRPVAVDLHADACGVE